MSFSNILARFDDDAYLERLLPELDDADWTQKFAAVAAARGASPENFARTAVARFADGAGDADWLSLLSALNSAADPGALCLRRMIDWAIARDADLAASQAGKGQ